MTCTTAWIRKRKLYGARSLTLTRLNVFHLNLSHLKFSHPNLIPHLKLISHLRLSPLVDSDVKSLLNPISHLRLPLVLLDVMTSHHDASNPLMRLAHYASIPTAFLSFSHMPLGPLFSLHINTSLYRTSTSVQIYETEVSFIRY